MVQPPKKCWVDRVSVERLITDQWGSAPLNRGNPKVPRKVMSPSSGSKGPIMCRIRRTSKSGVGRPREADHGLAGPLDTDGHGPQSDA